MATLSNSLSFVFKKKFLPKYRVIYYDYYGKVVQWDIMKLVCIAGYCLNVSFKQVNQFVYLGGNISENGRVDVEVRRRI